VPQDELRPLLEHGRVEVLGRIPWGSNATLLVEVSAPEGEGTPVRAVYKPRQGERPLWDFPDGLDRREVASYELSRALGWGIVPLTVLREDLPFGVGSLQLFVPFDPEQHYFTLLDEPGHHPALQTICCFDLVTNQADRKGGHCLLDEDKRIWAVDNGLAFHTELKLRTVIWDFAGEEIPDPLRDDLLPLADDLPDEVATHLDNGEREALRRLARAVAGMATFPHDPTGRRIPWPPV
jgi:uncharacterized repeat protein (TIGR03843 family)